MAKRVQILGHAAVDAEAFEGREREVTVNTTRGSLHVHDGVTPGGTEMATASLGNVPAATTAQAGKMSAAQVTQLDAATTSAAANAAAIIVNAAAITAEEAARIAGDALKLDKISATNGHALIVSGAGTAVASAGYAPTRLDTGVKAMFVQNAAPAGWTFDATNNDRVIRVTGTEANGGNTGGTWTISGITVNNHTLDISEIPAHTHSYNTPSGSLGVSGAGTPVALPATGSTTGSAGGGGAHNHGVTFTPGWRPNYLDVIVCTRD